MNWTDNLKDPVILTIWGGITAALGFFSKEISNYLRSKVDLKKTEIEKEPDRDRVWMDGMMKLVEQLDKRIQDQSKTIDSQSIRLQALTDEVSDLNEHVDALTSVLKENNITPPPRRRRAASASIEVTD